MNIPLPTQFTQQPGGVGGMLNALLSGGYKNDISRAEAKYKPTTLLAKAASELAYSQLIGPQYIAKLMNNPKFVAGLTTEQQNQLPQSEYAAGMGVGNSTNSLANLALQQAQQTEQGGSGSNWFVNHLKGIFSGNGATSSTPPANSLLQQPGMSAPSSTSSTSMPEQTTSNNAYAYDKNGNNITGNPQDAVKRIDQQQNQKDLFQKSGEAQGREQQEIGLGKGRAKGIEELGDQYMQDAEAMKPIAHLLDMTQTPEWENLRKDIPYFQDIQLQNLGKIGNPAQQQMIGDFIVSTKKAIANTVNGFNGRAMAKEFDFANSMKVSDNDTLGVTIGKLQALSRYTQGTMERNRLATQYMSAPYNMNKGNAYVLANQNVDMNLLQDQIAKKYQFPVKLVNKKTHETKYVPLREYNKSLPKHDQTIEIK